MNSSNNQFYWEASDFYSHVSSSYEPKNPKPYQKRKVDGQMKFDDVDEAYHTAIRQEKKKTYAQRYQEHKLNNKGWQEKTRHFTDDEIEELFWSQLVQLGWQFYKDEKGVKSLVLACPECDSIRLSILYVQIDTYKFKSMSDESFIKDIRNAHQCQNRPKTKP